MFKITLIAAGVAPLFQAAWLGGLPMRTGNRNGIRPSKAD